MVEGGGWQRDGPVPWYAKLVMGMVIIFGQVDLDTLFLDRLHNQIRESTVYPGTARIGYHGRLSATHLHVCCVFLESSLQK